MRTLITAALAGVTALGFASSASAYHFIHPVNRPFGITGSLTVTAAAVSLPCTANFNATTVGTGATITSASFSGVSCAALTASGLPWPVTIAGLHSIKIHNVAVSAVVLGVCGPGDVKAQLNATGKIVIAGAGLPGLVPCSVSATLDSKPNLKIGGHR
ncbi:MAG: hypothetical protein ACR2F8_08025 [Caulobacteraceae bacterium]